jgi:serine phosphatase RsbU (regulator of sigma subunit)
LKQEFANPDVKCDNVPELTVPLNRDTAVEWAGRAGDGTSRSDARENRERILEAASRLLAQSPAASLGDVAAAAGVSRSTLYRHFAGRQELIAALGQRPREEGSQGRAEPFPPGRLGRERPVPLDAIHVFDAVAPPVLPEQIVAEAQRVAKVALGLYVLDIDGSHLLRVAGPERLPERLEAPLAIGPELDSDGLSELRRRLADHPGIEVVPLWLRGRATAVMLTLGRPQNSLAEIARQAAAATTLADRYTDAFARATRRKQPTPAAEIQQSLLPPRISRITGGEVAGNVIPSYEVAGDWFDVVENSDGVWVTLADGLGGGTRATASSAVALGALRASRRGGGTTREALMLMHTTLRQMPGPHAEMTAVAARWDPASRRLSVTNCGQVTPIIIRADQEPQRLRAPNGRGLGGRSSPTPTEQTISLESGDRLVMVSNGVVGAGKGKAGLGIDGLIEAALRSERATAADTVRKLQTAVLEASGGELEDDATMVCLSVS